MNQRTSERAGVHKGARAGHLLTTTTTRRKYSEMATAALAAATMKRGKVAVAYEENARMFVCQRALCGRSRKMHNTGRGGRRLRDPRALHFHILSPQGINPLVSTYVILGSVSLSTQSQKTQNRIVANFILKGPLTTVPIKNSVGASEHSYNMQI